MKDLIQYISEYKNTNPDLVFLKTSRGNLTYKDIFIQVNNLSNNLYQNKQKQRYIGLLIDDSPEFIISYLAIQRISDIAILFSPHTDTKILQQKIKSFKLSKIIYDEKYRAVVENSETKAQKIVVSNPENEEICLDGLIKPSLDYKYKIPFINIDQPSIVLFTSGTNGNPKNILFSHRSIITNAIACQSITENKKYLNYMSFPDFSDFISQILTLCSAICSKGSITIPEDKTTGTILETIKQKNVNVFVSVPKNLHKIINHKKHTIINNLEYTLSLGSQLEEEFIDLWENKYCSSLLQGYGLAETLIVSFNKRNDETKPGTIGKPISICDMKIFNTSKIEMPTGRIGELHIKSKSNLISYFNSEKNKKCKDKWIPTGDLARKDHEGYFHYIDKKMNIIHRFGFTVFPEEIEKIMLKHPDIENIHVMKMLGEKDDNIKFCIVPTKNTKPNQAEIKEYARKNLPQFLQPEFIEFYKKFPENYLGKILRNKFIHSH